MSAAGAGRTSRSRSATGSRRATECSRRGSANRSVSSCSADSVGHSASSSRVSWRLSASSSRMSARSPASSRPRPPRVCATWSASSRTASRWKIRLASLCGLRRAPGPGPGRVGDVPGQPHPLLLDDQLDRPPRQLLPVAHRRARSRRPSRRRPLTAAVAGRLRAARVQPGEQLPDRAEHDAGLPQRRQHLPDVAQERRVRARPPARRGGPAGRRWV